MGSRGLAVVVAHASALGCARPIFWIDDARTYEFKPLPGRYFLVRRVLAPLWRRYMQAGVEAAARHSQRFRDLYRGRAAVERAFGDLKHGYGLAPLRVRGLERVALHADLTMLARLGQALSRARDAAAIAA